MKKRRNLLSAWSILKLFDVNGKKFALENNKNIGFILLPVVKQLGLAKSAIFYRKISKSIDDDSLTIWIKRQRFIFFLILHFAFDFNCCFAANTMNRQLACKSQKEQNNANNAKSHWIDGIQVFFCEFEHIVSPSFFFVIMHGWLENCAHRVFVWVRLGFLLLFFSSVQFDEV